MRIPDRILDIKPLQDDLKQTDMASCLSFWINMDQADQPANFPVAILLGNKMMMFSWGP